MNFILFLVLARILVADGTEKDADRSNMVRRSARYRFVVKLLFFFTHSPNVKYLRSSFMSEYFIVQEFES